MLKRTLLLSLNLCVFALLLSCKDEVKDYWTDHVGTPEEDPHPSVKPENENPRYLWVESYANFYDLANSKENIARDLNKAKEAGFTDIVVDVRSSCGDVLYKTDKVDQVKYQYAWVNGIYQKVERTAQWDYLQAFIDEGHKIGLRVNAAFNTFVAGNTAGGGFGLLYRDATKAKSWATMMNTKSGIKSIMDDPQEGSKFINPSNPEVQEFLCGLLRDLAKYEDLDGIFLDRGRFLDLRTDFSDLSRKQFEDFIGTRVGVFPDDILPRGTQNIVYLKEKDYAPYTKKWLEFRAKVIYDFMNKAKQAIKSENPNIKFGVYVGGWYSQYTDFGVNWASSSYHPTYAWASKNYNKYGYAGLMDHMLIGAYASPNKVYGSSEWTIEGFCKLANEKINGACKVVAGGPDVGNWDYEDKVSQADENAAIVNSVGVCINACGGYFLFDMCHLRSANQWQYVKEGVHKANLD